MQTSGEKTIVFLGHLTGWLIFIVTPIFNDPDVLEGFSRHPEFFIMNNLFLIAYFYLNLTVFVPHFLSKKKILLFIGITLGCMFVYFILPDIVHKYFLPEPPYRRGMPFDERGRDFFQNENIRPHRTHPVDIMKKLGLYAHITYFLIVFIISTGLKVITQWYDEKRRLTELENSKVEAELSFLKSQIHPHFLFNSLNTIYYLALSKDDKAPEAILSLSNFLRFVTVESDKNLIPLEKELAMLNEYLNLQRLRTSEKFDLQVEMKGDVSALKIMPLTFIPFVENAFKYGISAHIDCFIHLRIEVEQNTLAFIIKNSIIQGQKEMLRSSGIGLKNIRKRLELAYPERHTLDIENAGQIYSVYLKINLT
ncbi:MAG: histidine kinase [Tannerella sp.]|jgi:hypothetical protein|nr:histidine kinase [Tannerella sp.]